MHQKLKLPVIAILIIILLVILATALGRGAQPQDDVTNPTLEGVAYLRTLEEKDPTTVENTLKELRRRELLEQREARLAELESGDISIWSLFEDYMLMGDSRVMGFSFYEYLDQSRVLAEKGDTIWTLQEHIPEIVAVNPSYLFISYGVNDVGSGMWASPEDYVQDFSDIISEIRQELPDVKIFINSILLAYAPAFNTSAAWYDIPEYNTALDAMCSDMGCFYVDNTSICEEYAGLYESDGIHVGSSFYSHWATNMIMAIYDSETDQSELE